MDRILIQKLTAEAVPLLKEMIAIPSPSFSEGDVCTHISNWLTDRGIVHERVGNNIIARMSDQKIGAQSELPTDNADTTHDTSAIRSVSPTLMLCAHIDTVAPCEGYSFDPYTPDYEKAAEAIGSKEIIAGLGSNDDGASVVSMIAAFRYFMEHPLNSTLDDSGNALDDRKNIILVLTCEEERSGINGMTGLWSQIKDQIDYAIVGEPTGMRAATAERGLLVIDAISHGVSGHAARNEGVNAITIALEDISRMQKHEFAKISPRMGKVNLNVTQINAGTAHNVIPDTCSFVIDIRPTEQYTNEDILAELQAICKSELKPRNLSNRSSATFEESQLQQTAEKLGIETFSSPTTSDWMRIDCDAIKMGPGNSSRSHRKDEFVFVREIEDGVRTYIEFIEEL